MSYIALDICKTYIAIPCYFRSASLTYLKLPGNLNTIIYIAVIGTIAHWTIDF